MPGAPGVGFSAFYPLSCEGPCEFLGCSSESLGAGSGQGWPEDVPFNPFPPPPSKEAFETFFC